MASFSRLFPASDFRWKMVPRGVPKGHFGKHFSSIWSHFFEARPAARFWVAFWMQDPRKVVPERSEGDFGSMCCPMIWPHRFFEFFARSAISPNLKNHVVALLCRQKSKGRPSQERAAQGTHFDSILAPFSMLWSTRPEHMFRFALRKPCHQQLGFPRDSG